MIVRKGPTVLCILDGLGLNPKTKGNAVALAKKPTLDKLLKTCPWTSLITHGSRVGLPEGHMGNSEVGHLNIGAGRVVEQWLYKITKEFDQGFLKNSSSFNRFCDQAKGSKGSSAVHLIGLYSHGGVHSDAEHLFKIINELTSRQVSKIVLHLILDGRDTLPRVAKEDVAELIKNLKSKPNCVIGSVSGRFFAMDRDTRWDRTQKAYDVIFSAKGEPISDILKYLDESYSQNITDEFIEPKVVTTNPIKEDDLLFFYNFRADRMRQIVSSFTNPVFTHFERTRVHSTHKTLTMTEYDSRFQIPFLFESVPIKNHLGETISKAGLNQLRTAETEKYPHVTYFFNGLNEDPFLNEDRKLIPSPRDVKTYDLKPEMSAFGVRDVVIEALRSKKYSLIVVNFANCDMVGHTGVLEAAIKAVETVDTCLGDILKELEIVHGNALIIADHGNAEQMVQDEPNSDIPHTSHTTFEVPSILVGIIGEMRKGGALCDVAPTILKMMGLAQPKEMTGQPLY